MIERYRTIRTERKILDGCRPAWRVSLTEGYVWSAIHYRSFGRTLLSVFLNGSEGAVMLSSRVTSTSPGSGLLGLTCLRFELA